MYCPNTVFFVFKPPFNAFRRGKGLKLGGGLKQTKTVINNNIVNISRNENCQNDIDAYDYYKKLYTNPNDAQKKTLNHYKQDANLCKRRKAVYGLEFSSLIADAFLGTLCCVKEFYII